MNSNYKYTIYSFKETEQAPGYTYAGVYNPPSLISYFVQAPFSLDINADGNPDVIVPMNRGYASGIDTRVPFLAFSTDSGKLEYDATLNSQMPVTAGARRAEPLYLAASKTNAIVTVAHDTGDGQGADLLIMTGISGDLMQQDRVPTLPSGSTERPTTVNAHSMATGDINGDGLDDILVGDWGLDWSLQGAYALLQKTDGNFEISHQDVFDSIINWPMSGTGGDGSNLLLDLHLFDANGDGYDDLVTGFGHGSTDSYLFMNEKGAYRLEDKQALPTSVYGIDNQLHMKTLSADFDLDGDQDLAILRSRYEPYYGGNYMQFLTNDGNGNFTDTTSTAFDTPLQSAYGDRLEWTDYWQLIDVNSDGAMDIVGQSVGSERTTGLVFTNNGKGVFSKTEITLPDSLDWASIIRWGDFNQNGKLELVTFESTWDDAAGKSSSNYFKVYELSSTLASSMPILTGTSGVDRLTGTSEDDTLRGYAGNDQMKGEAGNDILIGGEGVDKLTGGAGADTFVFDNYVTSGASSADKIADFKVSEGDTFAFDASIFASLAGGISAGNVVIGTKVKALDADDYLIFVTKGGKLYYDHDGSGSGVAVQIAGVKGSLSGIDYTSFVIDGS